MPDQTEEAFEEVPYGDQPLSEKVEELCATIRQACVSGNDRPTKVIQILDAFEAGDPLPGAGSRRDGITEDKAQAIRRELEDQRVPVHVASPHSDDPEKGPVDDDNAQVEGDAAPSTDPVLTE